MDWWIRRQHFVDPEERCCTSDLDYKCRRFAAVADPASIPTDIAEGFLVTRQEMMKVLGSIPGMQTSLLLLYYLRLRLWEV
jgi:hypothetical protein